MPWLSCPGKNFQQICPLLVYGDVSILSPILLTLATVDRISEWSCQHIWAVQTHGQVRMNCLKCQYCLSEWVLSCFCWYAWCWLFFPYWHVCADHRWLHNACMQRKVGCTRYKTLLLCACSITHHISCFSSTNMCVHTTGNCTLHAAKSWCNQVYNFWDHALSLTYITFFMQWNHCVGSFACVDMTVVVCSAGAATASKARNWKNSSWLMMVSIKTKWPSRLRHQENNILLGLGVFEQSFGTEHVSASSIACAFANLAMRRQSSRVRNSSRASNGYMTFCKITDFQWLHLCLVPSGWGSLHHFCEHACCSLKCMKLIR